MGKTTYLGEAELHVRMPLHIPIVCIDEVRWMELYCLIHIAEQHHV